MAEPEHGSGTAVLEAEARPSLLEETGHDFVQGVWGDNGVSRQLLGLCSVLAITNTVINCIGMGIATTFVLTASNGLVSAVRNIIPKKVRIPAYIVIIATFVTITDLVMAAYFPSLYDSLGIFIPLIVVNCIIFARAESFASRNTVPRALADGLGMGVGFTICLFFLGGIRELFGSGTLLGYTIFGPSFVPFLIMVLPAGGFFVFGFLVAFYNMGTEWRKRARFEALKVA